MPPEPTAVAAVVAVPVAKRRVLLVDDEPALLDGLRRLLGAQYAITTAPGGPEAVAVLEADAAFDVIVSDMRMPAMDGATFLRHAVQLAPLTPRLLLTGQTDIPSAMRAVNDGAIFRFLAKPCDPTDLRAALAAAVRHGELVRAERELLDSTLTGSIQLLTDVLELAAPAIFARARRITRIALHVARQVAAVDDLWSFELAARLVHIGCVALPAPLLERVGHRARLTADEDAVWQQHPATAARLIGAIPRLRPVAEMVRQQLQRSPVVDVTSPIALGAAVLQLALDLDDVLATGSDLETALARLAPRHDKRLVRALVDFNRHVGMIVANVRVAELQPEMILDEDLRSRADTLILASGVELTAVVVERVRTFASNGGCREPIRVRVPG